jgi:tetratricopeptide (TPR) repeat protein
MTELAHPPEAPEMPHGDDSFERGVAVLIMVVAFLGAFAAYLEVKTSNREARADRNAKIQLVEMAAARNWQSEQQSVSTLIDAERTDVKTFAPSPGAALIAFRKDKSLARESATSQTDHAFYVHDQTARAYERQRDGRTSQATRLVTVITTIAVALLLLGHLVATVPRNSRRGRRVYLAVPCAIVAITVAWAVYIWTDRISPPDQRAIASYATGRVFLDRGNAASNAAAAPLYRRAVAPLSAAISREPNYADAYRDLGESLTDLGLYERALPYAGRATTLAPHDFQAWNDLAVAEWWSAHFKAAASAVDHAYALNPEDLWVSFNAVEGAAIAGEDPPAYADRVQHLEGALRSEGAPRTTDLSSGLQDVDSSAYSLRGISKPMTRVCKTIFAIAHDLHIALGSYDCNKLRYG